MSEPKTIIVAIHDRPQFAMFYIQGGGMQKRPTPYRLLNQVNLSTKPRDCYAQQLWRMQAAFCKLVLLPPVR